MTNPQYNNTPPSTGYRGMIRIAIPGTTRTVQVYGWGEEAEAIALAEWQRVMEKGR